MDQSCTVKLRLPGSSGSLCIMMSPCTCTTSPSTQAGPMSVLRVDFMPGGAAPAKALPPFRSISVVLTRGRP